MNKANIYYSWAQENIVEPGENSSTWKQSGSQIKAHVPNDRHP